MDHRNAPSSCAAALETMSESALAAPDLSQEPLTLTTHTPLPCPSFPCFFCGKRQEKPTKTTRIFIPSEPLKSLEKKGKRSKKQGNPRKGKKQGLIWQTRIYPYPMVWPLPRPWSETMVSDPLCAQKTREVKGFLGLGRPFLDLVSQTPRPRRRGRPFFAD